MNRKEIKSKILTIFKDEFEIENPKTDVDLRENYEFDSIDAIELLTELEKMLNYELTQNEKKKAMDIRTIDQIVDYVESIVRTRNKK